MTNAQNKPQRPLAKQNTTSDWLFSFRERESGSKLVWCHTKLDSDSLSRKLKSQSEVVFCLANGLCGLFCALFISDSAPHEIFLEKRVWVARLGWVVVSQFDSYGCRILRTLWTSHKRRCMLGVLKVVPLSIEG